MNLSAPILKTEQLKVHSESFHFILAMEKAAIDPIVKLNINDTEQTINELSIAIPKFPLTHA